MVGKRPVFVLIASLFHIFIGMSMHFFYIRDGYLFEKKTDVHHPIYENKN